MVNDSDRIRIELSYEQLRAISAWACDHTDDPEGQMLYDICINKLAAIARREEYQKRP